MVDLNKIGKQAKAAAGVLAITPTEQKDKALLAIADALADCEDAILEANQQDVAEGRENGLSEALIDRLLLTSDRLAGIARDVRSVVNLPDPVGREYDESVREDGLKIRKRRTPLGVLGVIYESRPNVTVDVAALALKSGNAVILRGGKETVRSNKALTEAIQQGLSAADLPADCVQVIADPDRALVMGLLKLQDYVDMIIPRGGMGLHKFCRENSTIPVMTGGIGICHLFVDDTADLDKAVPVVQNAKVQRPSVCNALDTLLVHQAVAAEFLPRVVEQLAQDGVIFKADKQALEILNGAEPVEAAGDGAWDTEWLSLTLGLKVVEDMKDAIAHIKAHSTGHSDGILTQTDEHANYFVDVVDSSVVFVNASTRFNDGSQLGLGAEVAISTQKLHARGPMALEELTTYKWIVVGDGHFRK